MEEKYQCVVCGSRQGQTAFTVGEYGIVRCAACSHGQVSPMPPPAQIESLYRHQEGESLLGSGLAREVSDHLQESEGRWRDHFSARLGPLKALGTTPAQRVLDYGCSNGSFVWALGKAGFSQACGYDITERLVEEGRRRWGADLHSGRWDDFRAGREEPFDVITSYYVLEHVRDPRKLLQDFQSRLSPGGGVVISVPNLRSLQVFLAGTKSPIIDPPHHLQYFTPRSLRHLLDNAGFDVVRLQTPFWNRDTDTFLRSRGYSFRAARLMRWCMAIPSAIIQGLRWGGVITAVARVKAQAKSLTQNHKLAIAG